MINKDRIQSAMTLFMANDHWREYYETAPSEICKKRIGETVL